MKILRICGCLAALALAGAASAGETAPSASSGASSKVGIDPTTGRVRALTAEESAALDATTVVTPRRMRASVSGYQISLPQTDEEAAATARVVRPGVTAMKAPPSAISSVVARRTADGRIEIFHEGDEGATHAAPEATSE